jgi:chemotaxis protein methyltransferase CheR
MESEVLTPEQFEDFGALITGTLGIKMPPAKRVMLQSRLHRRIRELGLESFAEYHERFFNDPEIQAVEIEHLLNLATTNKTDFFREPDHFSVLVSGPLAHWRRQRPSNVFRVWCAGCATGEEAYTLAIILLEAGLSERFEFSILATDVSTRALDVAMRGVYTEDRITPVPAPLVPKYFLRSCDPGIRRYKIAPEVRNRIKFGHLNFLSPHYGIREVMDVVFFRNVMIYFDHATQQQVVSRICRNLRPGGHLFTAHAESLQGLNLPLRVAGTAVYQLANATAK